MAQRSLKPTNSIIVTDPHLLNHANEDILSELISTLNNVIPTDEEMLVSHLKSFNRIIFTFKDMQNSQDVYKLLTDENIRCNYSLKNNPHPNAKNEELSFNNQVLLSPIVSDEDNQGVERFPVPVFYPHDEPHQHLDPPPRTVQLQSPPPSPYLGYTQKIEEAPDEITMTDPESLKHILYQPTLDDADKEKVFNGPNDLDDDDLIESLDDFKLDDDNGSCATLDSVPILIVNREEAQILREVHKQRVLSRTSASSSSSSSIASI